MNSKELFDILHPGVIVQTNEGCCFDIVLYKTSHICSALSTPHTEKKMYAIWDFEFVLECMISQGERVDIFDKDGVLLYEFGES